MFQKLEFYAFLRKAELELRPLTYRYRLGCHWIAHRGLSSEFANYRPYQPGEDPKDIDWKLFARSDRLYLKQRDALSVAKVGVLLDASASMTFSSEKAQHSKLRMALLFAFGIGSILQHQNDILQFHAWPGSYHPLVVKSSKSHFSHLIRHLEQLDQQDSKSFHADSNQLPSFPFLDHLFVISDFLQPIPQCKESIQKLASRTMALSCIQILDPEETTPDSSKSWIEHLEIPGSKRTVHSTDWSHHQKNLQAHADRLHQVWSQYRVGYHQISTGIAFQENFGQFLNTEIERNHP